VPYGSSEWALYVGAILLAITLSLRYARLGGQYQIVGLDFGVSLLSMWLVAGASREYTGAAGRWLSWPLLMSVGRISYGLYVYHGFTPYLLGRYVPGFMSMAAPIRVAMLFTATALVAMASWRWLEQPFLRLKSQARLRSPVMQASYGEVSP
jgi:peptidoglycan/LPS O-acetylase OafA/YrhL